MIAIINLREYRRAIKNGQSRETGEHKVHKTKTNKPKHNSICGAHHYAQANTNNVYITRAFLETSGWKDEPNIGFCGNRNGHHNMELRNKYT
jgi:hypothetical protein